MPEVETVETLQPVEQKSTDWPKIILVAVLGLGLLASAACAGYWYGTESANLKSLSASGGSKPQPKSQIQETSTPTPAPLVEDQTTDWKTRDSRRLSDLTTIQVVLEQYFAQNGAYPTSPLPSAGQVWSSGGITYLKSMPGDPSGGNYEYCKSGSNYEVCATMEGTTLPSDCRLAAYGCSRNCCVTNPF